MENALRSQTERTAADDTLTVTLHKRKEYLTDSGGVRYMWMVAWEEGIH